MALVKHPLLGVCYLSPDDFIELASAFGADASVAITSEAALLAALAGASRAVDNYCGRTFDPKQTVTENHKWDGETSRIFPNAGPIIALNSYRIRIGGSYVANFAVTPVVDTTFGEVYYNPQENYLELVSLASAYSLTSQMLGLGLTEPQVEIIYTSYTAVPPSVAMAVGITVAHRINSNLTNQILTPGMKLMKIDGQTYERDTTPGQAGGAQSFELPQAAKECLSEFSGPRWG